MNADDKTLALFTTRVRQLILQYNSLKEQNAKLTAEAMELSSTIDRLKSELAEVRTNYDSLKIAKMIEITDGDLDSAQKRISKLIRDVGKCITLLSEK